MHFLTYRRDCLYGDEATVIVSLIISAMSHMLLSVPHLAWIVPSNVILNQIDKHVVEAFLRI